MIAKCVFGGKKGLAAALLAAAMMLPLIFGCSSGGDEAEYAPPQSQSPSQGGMQNPNQGGNQGGGENPGQGEEQGGGQDPEQGENQGGGQNPGEETPGQVGEENPAPASKEVKTLLKEIVGEAEYEAASKEAAEGKMTLTAEAIKAVGDFFPALENAAASGEDASGVDAETKAAVSQHKEAFVAQAEGEMKIVFGPIYPDWYEEHPFLFYEEAEKKYVVTYKNALKFEDVFNLGEISLPNNNGKGDFTNATLTNNGEDITLDKFNNIRGSSLPTLKFNKNNVKYYSSSEGYVSESSVYNLYKDYSKNLNKLDIKGDFNIYAINGKEISGDENYTLFKDENTVKTSDNDTVKSLSIDVLIQMYEQLRIQKFVNMIISGTPKEKITVDWDLTNIVFEGDMSKIKNKGTGNLTGIVYFKDKPYTNIDRTNASETNSQAVYGLLKLDKLEGVSYNTFGVSLSHNSAVLDVSNIDTNTINSYNSDGSYGILARGGYAHAIYFNEGFKAFKDNQEKINELCHKFSKHPEFSAGFINAYLGEDRVYGESYYATDKPIGAKNPRSLKEFEYFGNYDRFEKSAKETYGNEFKNLSDFDKATLEEDANGLNKIAQNNKSRIRGAVKFFV